MLRWSHRKSWMIPCEGTPETLLRVLPGMPWSFAIGQCRTQTANSELRAFPCPRPFPSTLVDSCGLEQLGRWDRAMDGDWVQNGVDPGDRT